MKTAWSSTSRRAACLSVSDIFTLGCFFLEQIFLHRSEKTGRFPLEPTNLSGIGSNFVTWNFSPAAELRSAALPVKDKRIHFLSGTLAVVHHAS